MDRPHDRPLPPRELRRAPALRVRGDAPERRARTLRAEAHHCAPLARRRVPMQLLRLRVEHVHDLQHRAVLPGRRGPQRVAGGVRAPACDLRRCLGEPGEWDFDAEDGEVLLAHGGRVYR